MENFWVQLLIIAVYSFFAIRWGFRFVNGRWAWLEKPNRKILKRIISFVVGYFLVGFYFLAKCLQFVFTFFEQK
ncbi:MAG: hypothetical protein HFE57_05335 [Firmicutes bacterium]|jgi:hypothetical protein|nr:hypothetical protein [Bacillota bacterium]